MFSKKTTTPGKEEAQAAPAASSRTAAASTRAPAGSGGGPAPSSASPTQARPAGETRKPAAPNPPIPHEAIAKLAFIKWQKNGCPAGEDQRYWFEAERELKAQPAGAARRGSPP